MKATPEMRKKIIDRLAANAETSLSPEIQISKNHYKTVCRWIYTFYGGIEMLDAMGMLSWQETRRLQQETLGKILDLDHVTKKAVSEILEKTFTKPKEAENETK